MNKKVTSQLVFLVLPAILFCCTSSFSQAGNELKVQWERIGPGGGGATFLPTFSYHTPDRFLIRCDMTGSYLTDNSGESYQQLNFDNGASGYAFDPHNPQIIYAGSAVLNRSADGGKIWQQVFPSRNEITNAFYYGDHAEYKIETSSNSLYASEYDNIKNIKVDPADSKTVYFSMGKYFYYSVDACKTFQRTDLQNTIGFIYTNTTSLKNEVYIFTSSTLYVFNKGSRSLKEVMLPKEMTPAFSICGGIKRDSDEMIFYALHHTNDEPLPGQYNRTELWMSLDKGVTWKQVRDNLITNNNVAKPNFAKISCAEYDAQQAYLISDLYETKNQEGTLQYWYGAIKTADAGKRWQWAWKAGGGSGTYGIKDGSDASNLHDAWASKAFGGEFIEVEDIGVYPHDGNVAVLTDWYRTMKTTDGGKTWQEIYSALQKDGTYASRGLDVTTAYGVHFDPFDSNHIAISYTDIGFHHSYNNGKSWNRSVNGVPAEWVNTCYWVVFDQAEKNKLWSAWSGMHDIPRGKMTRNPSWKKNYKGGICVSTDGGNTWQPSNMGMGDDALITSLILDEKTAPGKRTLYAVAYNKGVFKSTDDGKTWQLKNNGITNNACAFELTLAADGTVYLVVSPTPTHESKNDKNLFYSGEVYKSTDGAESWQKLSVTNELFFPNGITTDPDNPKRIYLACWSAISLSDLVGGKVALENGGNKNIPMKGGIYVSEDAGVTWSSVFDQQQYVYDVAVDPFHKGRLWCNTFNKAAYRSDDYGKTWKQIKGYDFHWGHRIIVDQHDPEKIYITTYGSSVWHGAPVVE